jgi:hypothetical protein
VKDAAIVKKVASQAILTVALTLRRERETRRISSVGSEIVKNVVLHFQASSIMFDAGDLKAIGRANRFRIEREWRGCHTLLLHVVLNVAP